MNVGNRDLIDSESLRFVAAFLGLLVAGIHLYWGLPRFVAYSTIDWFLQPDPRPLAFVVSAHLILLGITLGAFDLLDRRVLYVGGIVLVGIYFLGYAAWHTVLSHGGFWPWAPPAQSHGGNPISTIGRHLLSDPFALVSKLAEVVLIVVLGVLYLLDSPD